MIQSDSRGVVLAVRVTPRAGRSGVAGWRDDLLLVRVSAPPVDGAANAELIEVIADALDVPRRAVSIVGGEMSRQKRILVQGLDLPAVRRRLRPVRATKERN